MRSSNMRVFRRLRDLERDSHPPQPVVPADEFDRVVTRLNELIASMAHDIARLQRGER